MRSPTDGEVDPHWDRQPGCHAVVHTQHSLAGASLLTATGSVSLSKAAVRDALSTTGTCPFLPIILHIYFTYFEAML